MDSELFPADGRVAGPESGHASGHAAAPRTGDPRVDEAVAGLAALGSRPLEEHPRALGAAHDTLRGLLGELGEPSRPGVPGRPGLQGEL